MSAILICLLFQSVLSAGLHLCRMAKYNLADEHVMVSNSGIYIQGVTLTLNPNSGRLSAKSLENVLLFVIRQDNSIVYPCSDFIKHRRIHLTPILDVSVDLQLDDRIILVIPHERSTKVIHGISGYDFYVEFMKFVKIQSSEQMFNHLSTVIEDNPRLQKGYSILAMGVGLASSNQILDVIEPVQVNCRPLLAISLLTLFIIFYFFG